MPINSVEDLCNESLRVLGSKLSIGDIYEGTPQANACLEIYSQTRDEVLRAGEWSFARGYAALTLLKGPPPDGGYSPLEPWSPVYPMSPWLYEFAYPSDCIEIRDLIKQPRRLPVLDPKPVLYRIDNDLVPIVSGDPPEASGPPQKVILANTAEPLAIYVRRVTNLLLWEPDFTATLVDAVAKKISASPALGNPEMMKMLPQETAAVGAVAQRHQG